MRISPLLVLLTVAIPARLAAQRPHEPYIDDGACPFECCTYRDWTALNAIRVYAAPRKAAPVSFTIPRGERFRALTGHVRFDRVGVVVMRHPMTLSGDQDRDTVRVAPGDTVYVLSDMGEGYVRLWVRGHVVSEEEFWMAPGQDQSGDPHARGILIREPVEMWWVKVRSRTGRIGWIRMDQAEERGADACG